MTHAQARSELTDLFIAVYRVMEGEGGDRWSRRSVEGIIAGLQQDDGDEEAVLNALRSYRSATGFPGSFSDYYICRDDPDAMRTANLAFSAMKRRAWTLMNAVRSGKLGGLEPAPPPREGP